MNDQWVVEKIREEIKKFLRTNKNENMAFQKLWDTGKGLQRRKFVAWVPTFKNQRDLK
jgi:hypothetical protein